MEEYVKSMKLEKCSALVTESQLSDIEKNTGISLGKGTKEYVLKYGYLAYKFLELYGINATQMEKSDMISQTIYLHKYFPKTAGYVALEGLGEGRYCLLDNSDKVYIYNSEEDLMTGLNVSLFEYIRSHFDEIGDL